MQTENNIQSALNKLKAAQRCHPNAVQTLIEEAVEFLELEPSPRITEQDAREIISKFLCGSEKTSDDGDITYWLNHEGGRHLLERLSKKQ